MPKKKPAHLYNYFIFLLFIKITSFVHFLSAALFETSGGNQRPTRPVQFTLGPKPKLSGFVIKVGLLSTKS